MQVTDLEKFVNNFYKSSRMILCAAGGIEHDKLVDLANKHLGDVSNQFGTTIPTITTPRFTGGEIRDRDDALPLTHAVIAFEGPPAESHENLALMLAAVIPGFWDESHVGSSGTPRELARRFGTRHDVSLRSFEHFHHCYQHTSLWGVYCTLPKMAAMEGIWYLQEEWLHMATGLREFHLQRGKNNLKSRLLKKLSTGTTAICQDIGKHVHLYDRRIPVAELMTRIDALHVDDVKQALMKYMYDRCPVVACTGPIEAFPDYVEIRGHTWWFRY